MDRREIACKLGEDFLEGVSRRVGGGAEVGDWAGWAARCPAAPPAVLITGKAVSIG